MSLPSPSNDHPSLTFSPSFLHGFIYLHSVCLALMSLSIKNARGARSTVTFCTDSKTLPTYLCGLCWLITETQVQRPGWRAPLKTLLQHCSRFLFSDILFLKRCLKQKRFAAMKMTLIFRKSRTKIMFWLLQRRLPYVVYLNAFRLKHDTIFGWALTGKNNSKNFLISEPEIL